MAIDSNWRDANQYIRAEAYKEIATRRLELLKRMENILSYCPICKVVRCRNVVENPRNEFNHAADCELAREIA